MTIPVLSQSFRNKLILAFTTLILLTVGVIVFLVNNRLHQASLDKIQEETLITVNVLKQLRQSELRNSSEAAATLIRDNVQLRSIITELNEEDLFDEGPSLEEQYAQLHDTVADYQIFLDSPLFIITDAQGKVLYQKGETKLIGEDISQWKTIQTALSGESDLFTWWGHDSPIYMYAPNPNQQSQTELYEVFFKPVMFGNQVFGLLIIGFDTTSQPEQIQKITHSEIAFFQKDQLYGTSSPESMHPILQEMASDFSQLEVGAIHPFTHNGEEFLAIAHQVRDSFEELVGTIVIFRSKTQELNIFSTFSERLNVIGLLAIFGGIIFAVLLSRKVVHNVDVLSRGAQEVANGNLEVVLPITSNDEFGNLARTFNKMTSGLKEKEHITDTFKKYVSSSVVDEVLKSDVELGGEKKEVTIYFTDLENFTAISEKLSPEELISFLNHYLSHMTQMVEEHAGVVDKYVGDAIMAFWGAPLPVENHPEKACFTALKQKKWHDLLHEQWKDHPQLSKVKTRFGIHTGEVIVGNVGSTQRLDYTIIGDSVNTASRLESLNKYYGTNILVSEATFQALGSEVVTREIDLVQVKGKNKPTRIYELICFEEEATDALKTMIPIFNRGRTHYLQKEFPEALALFQDCLKLFSKDQPSHIMSARCQGYLQAPPDENWTGIQIMNSK